MKGPIEDSLMVCTFEFNYLGVSETFTSISKLKQRFNKTTYRGKDNLPAVKLFITIDGVKYLAATLIVPMTEIEKLRQVIELKIKEFENKRKVDEAQHKTFFMDGAIRKKMGNKNAAQVISKNGATLTVVRSTLIDFGADVLVSLGHSIFGESDREGIVLDPASKVLVRHYEKLKICLKSNDQTEKLVILIAYLRLIFMSHDEQLIRTITVAHAKDELRSKDNKVQPLVSIDAFIEQSAGMCRHLALLGCHFLYRLMNERLIDCVEVV